MKTSKFIILTFALLTALFLMTNKAEACCANAPAEGVSAVMTTLMNSFNLGSTTAYYVATAAHWVLEIQDWIVKNASSAIQHALTIAVKQVDNIMSSTTVQAQIDAHAYETRKTQTVNHTMPGLMMLPQMSVAAGGKLGIDTGNNMCNVANGIRQMQDMGDAVNALTGAIVALTEHKAQAGTLSNSGADSSMLIAENELSEACKRGFIDVNANTAAQNKGCNTSAQFYPQFTNADINPHSIFVDVQYTMPSQTTTTAGPPLQLTLPQQSNLASVDEMQFVAAVAACKTFRPRTAEAPGRTAGGITTTNDASAIMAARLRTAQSNSGVLPCVQEIAKRTRIPKVLADAAAAGSVLARAYASQFQECRSLNEEGVINDIQNTDCVTNGISWLAADRARHCRHGANNNATGTPTYIAYLGGTGRGTDDVGRELSQNENTCTDYDNQIKARETEVSKIMHDSLELPARTDAPSGHQ